MTGGSSSTMKKERVSFQEWIEDDSNVMRSTSSVVYDSDDVQKRESMTVRSSSEEEDEFSSHNSPTSSVDADGTTENTTPRSYSVTELVATLGNDNVEDCNNLPPELARRVRDFRLAQRKRRETYGQQKQWGVFGMYTHLSNVRIDLEWAEDAAWRRRHMKPYLSWGDFEKERQKGFNRPFFTYSLIFICSFMMIVEIGLNGWKFAPLSVNPLIGPSAEALIDAGARDTPLIVEDGQWFRIFSPLILHAGLIHWGVNMLALWFIGAAVEECHGLVNAIVLFVIPGVGGNILSAIFLPQYISVGASGGIFGLIGGCLADISLNWKLLFIKSGSDENDTATRSRNIRAILWLSVDIFVNILFGLTPFVDNFTHLGGLFYGLCCGWSTIEPLAVGFFGVYSSTYEKFRSLFIRFFGLIISVIMIMVTTVVLATMDVEDNPCSGCRYISCVPFPFSKEEKWWYCDDCDFVSANLFKDDDGDDYYDRVELTCPGGDLENINISNDTLVERDDVRHMLPSYCRQYCEDRFA